ncbi:MAG: acyl-CoA thioesterase [Planctomycetes bacterium]|nr:acyl-CoA thioesterase [Planctomycetota bacterium]
MHETRIRVRFDEVDTMDVVHHPRYLVYFEVARTEYFRDLGMAYRDVMAGGTHLAIIEAGARYMRSAKYDDELVVETRCTVVGGASVTLRYAVRRGEETLATGFTRLGAVDLAGRAKRLPEDVRAKFAAVLESDPHGAGGSRVQTGA